MDTLHTYSVSNVRGCRVITGWLPVTDFVALAEAWNDGEAKGTDGEWFCDAVLAQHLGANMVLGPKSATLAWRAEIGLPVTPP